MNPDLISRIFQVIIILAGFAIMLLSVFMLSDNLRDRRNFLNNLIDQAKNGVDNEKSTK